MFRYAVALAVVAMLFAPVALITFPVHDVEILATENPRSTAMMRQRADEAAAALGIAPVSSNSSWDHETLYYGQYRRWRDLMSRRETGHG